MPIAEKTDKYGRQLMDIESILFAQNRLVFIDDVITDALASNVTKQLMYLASVSSEDITLVINSPGGSVTAGLAIYDTMQGLSCDVSTICQGMAASMGAFLLAAGTKGKRYSFKHGEKRWSEFLEIIEESDANPYLIMEFVKNDSEKQFGKDIKHLLMLTGA